MLTAALQTSGFSRHGLQLLPNSTKEIRVRRVLGSGSLNYDDEAGKMGMGRPYLAGSGACHAGVCGQPNR